MQFKLPLLLLATFFIDSFWAKDCTKLKSNTKLFCYYGNIKETDNLCQCTHVVLPEGTESKIVQKMRKLNADVKILLTVSEFNEKLVTLLKGTQVDGVELNLRKIDSKNDLTDFITTVKSKLGSEHFIAVSVPSKTESLAKNFDFKELSKHADVFILNTAFLGASQNVTFHPSRLSGLWDMQNTDSMVDLVNGLGAPLSKIVIAAPVQAFSFTLQNEDFTAPGSPATEVKSITRKELCDLMQEKGVEWTLERDQDQAGPYIFRGKQWIAFEDETSIDIKTKYARVRSLAGVALKDLSQDSETKCGSSILNAAFKGLSKQARAPRGAVLHTLEREILSPSPTHASSIHDSPFRISRIIDTEGKIHVVRQDTRTEFECSRQGYFVHPRSCNRFYRCVKFDQRTEEYNVFEFDCPAGLTFDEKTEVCVWPGSLPHASACSGSSEIAPVPRKRFSCPTEPGYYADPENCRWFFACLDHGEPTMQAYEFRCPFGLVFDEEKLLCEWPWLVSNCGLGTAATLNYFGGVSTNINQYDGLGVLQSVKLGGLQGPIQAAEAKTYSNVGFVGLAHKTLTDGRIFSENSARFIDASRRLGLSLKATQSLYNAGLLSEKLAAIGVRQNDFGLKDLASEVNSGLQQNQGYLHSGLNVHGLSLSGGNSFGASNGQYIAQSNIDLLKAGGNSFGESNSEASFDQSSEGLLNLQQQNEQVQLGLGQLTVDNTAINQANTEGAQYKQEYNNLGANGYSQSYVNLGHSSSKQQNLNLGQNIHVQLGLGQLTLENTAINKANTEGAEYKQEYNNLGANGYSQSYVNLGQSSSKQQNENLGQNGQIQLGLGQLTLENTAINQANTEGAEYKQEYNNLGANGYSQSYVNLGQSSSKQQNVNQGQNGQIQLGLGQLTLENTAINHANTEGAQYKQEYNNLGAHGYSQSYVNLGQSSSKQQNENLEQNGHIQLGLGQLNLENTAINQAYTEGAEYKQEYNNLGANGYSQSYVNLGQSSSKQQNLNLGQSGHVQLGLGQLTLENTAIKQANSEGAQYKQEYNNLGANGYSQSYVSLGQLSQLSSQKNIDLGQTGQSQFGAINLGNFEGKVQYQQENNKNLGATSQSFVNLAQTQGELNSGHSDSGQINLDHSEIYQGSSGATLNQQKSRENLGATGYSNSYFNLGQSPGAQINTQQKEINTGLNGYRQNGGILLQNVEINGAAGTYTDDVSQSNVGLDSIDFTHVTPASVSHTTASSFESIVSATPLKQSVDTSAIKFSINNLKESGTSGKFEQTYNGNQAASYQFIQKEQTPSVSFSSTGEQGVVSAQSYSQNGGYSYDKPSVSFEEKPVVSSTPSYVVGKEASTPSSVTSYSYTNTASERYQEQRPQLLLQQPQVVVASTPSTGPSSSYFTIKKTYQQPQVSFGQKVASTYNYIKPEILLQQPQIVTKNPEIVAKSYKYVQPQVTLKNQEARYNYVQPTVQSQIVYEQPQISIKQPATIVESYSIKPTVRTEIVKPAISQSFSYSEHNSRGGYKYEVPQVTLPEQPRVQKPTISSFNVDSSYKYNRPSVVFQEEQKVAQPQTSYQYFQPVVQQPRGFAKTSFQEEAVKTYSYSNPSQYVMKPATIISTNYKAPVFKSQQVEFQGYGYPRPQISFAEVPEAIVTNYDNKVPVVEEPIVPKKAYVLGNSFQYERRVPTVQFAKEQRVYTTPKPTFISTINSIVAQKATPEPQREFIYYDSRLDNTRQNQYFQASVQKGFEGYSYSKPSIKFEEAPQQNYQPQILTYTTPRPTYQSTIKSVVSQRLEPLEEQFITTPPAQIRYLESTTLKPLSTVTTSYLRGQQSIPNVEINGYVDQKTHSHSYQYSEQRKTAKQESVVIENQQYERPAYYSTERPVVAQKLRPATQEYFYYDSRLTSTPTPEVQYVETSTSAPIIQKAQRVEFEGYDYPKPQVVFEERKTSYENQVPVVEVPVVPKKAYVTTYNEEVRTGKPLVLENFVASNYQQNSPIEYTTPRQTYVSTVASVVAQKLPVTQEFTYSDSRYSSGAKTRVVPQKVESSSRGYNYPKPKVQLLEEPQQLLTTKEAQPIILENYVSPDYQKYDVSIELSTPSTILSQNIRQEGLSLEVSSPSPAIVHKLEQEQPIQPFYYYDRTSSSEIEKELPQVPQIKSRPRVTIIEQEKPFQKEQYFLDTSTQKQGLQYAEIETREPSSTYLPIRKRVRVTKPSRKYLPTSTTPSNQYLPSSTISSEYLPVSSSEAPSEGSISVENYQNFELVRKKNRPVKVVKIVRPRVKTVVVKKNDFNPFLSAKLGAQCTCTSNTIELRREPLRIEVSDDDEDDDGILVERKDGEAIVVEDFESEKVESATAEPEVYIRSSTVEIPSSTYRLKKVNRGRGRKSRVNIEASDVNIVASRVRVKTPRIDIVSDDNAEVNIETERSRVESAEITSKTFDRYGPGGVRSATETLQGIDCQRAGLFRHPNQCNKFYSCKWDCKKNKFTLHVFNCPVHLTFDNNLGACNWPSQGPACLENTLLPSE